MAVLDLSQFQHRGGRIWVGAMPGPVSVVAPHGLQLDGSLSIGQQSPVGVWEAGAVVCELPGGTPYLCECEQARWPCIKGFLAFVSGWDGELSPGSAPPGNGTKDCPPASVTSIQPERFTWVYEHENFLRGDPYVFDGQRARLRFEASANCGGANNLVQSAWLEARMIFDKDVWVVIEAAGVGELQETGYERLAVSWDGVPVIAALSKGGTLGCMEGPLQFSTPLTYRIMAPLGEHVCRMESSTVDALFHIGSWHQLEIQMFPG